MLVIIKTNYLKNIIIWNFSSSTQQNYLFQIIEYSFIIHLLEGETVISPVHIPEREVMSGSAGGNHRRQRTQDLYVARIKNIFAYKFFYNFFFAYQHNKPT